VASPAAVGEGSSISVQRLNFNQLRLTPSKLAVIVPTTNELLRRSDPATEQLIRDDLLEGTARTMDSTFLSSAAASAAAPAGILNGIAENAGGQIHAAATVTEIATAMKNMISALRNANIPMIAPAWIMNPRFKEFLRLFVTDIGVFPGRPRSIRRAAGLSIIDPRPFRSTGTPWPGI
jgi:HK97 family phage major capsid protein